MIVGVDGHSIDSSHDLTALVANLPVGKQTDVQILRKGDKKTVSVKLAKRADDMKIAENRVDRDDDLGLRLVALAPEAAHRLGYDEDENGVLVAAVKSGSRADRAGMQRGDLIKEVNRTPVGSLEDFYAQVGRTDKSDAIRLLIRRAKVGFVAISI